MVKGRVASAARPAYDTESEMGNRVRMQTRKVVGAFDGLIHDGPVRVYQVFITSKAVGQERPELYETPAKVSAAASKFNIYVEPSTTYEMRVPTEGIRMAKLGALIQAGLELTISYVEE